jgi:two-component system response regulator YesN
MRDAGQSFASAGETNRRQTLLALAEACQVACSSSGTDDDKSSELVRAWLARVLRHASAPVKISQNFRVVRALSYLEERFADRTVDLATAARHAAVTPSHLDRLLKEHTGLTFLQHLRRIRMQHAERLLVTTTASVKETAYASGYACPGSFHRDFMRTHGSTPRAWRDQVATVTRSLKHAMGSNR